MQEEAGSKQGGKHSALEFIVYNDAWSRIIRASNIGVKICGVLIGGFVCADDSLSIQSTLADLIAMSLIYEYFSLTYDILYAFNKTVLNVFNNAQMKETLMTDNVFQLGGCTPQFDSESVHLGLIMSEDLDSVDTLNVDNRIEKTWKKVFMSTAPNIIGNKNLPFT